MAKQIMGKLMGNRECEWVRPRLPLWAENGDANDRHATRVEGGDLSIRERRQIERHLAKCATCRDHRASLDQALGALAIAATQLPVLSEAPSLWPMLERQITSHSANAGLRWPQAGRARAARSARPRGDLDGVRPLRQAWTRDTIREALAGNLQDSESRRMSGLILKLGVAAAILVALIGTSVVRKQSKIAQSTIFANSMPLADPVIVSTVADPPALEISQGDTGEVSANQLAEAEPPRPVETSVSGLDPAAVAPKSPPHTRFGFDLEHGTPMPPDSREAKPVY